MDKLFTFYINNTEWFSIITACLIAALLFYLDVKPSIDVVISNKNYTFYFTWQSEETTKRVKLFTVRKLILR